MVKFLLDNSTDCTIESPDDWILLQLAAFNKHSGVENLLVIHRVPEPEDFYGLEQMFGVK